jgi:hypothetical protein
MLDLLENKIINKNSKQTQLEKFQNNSKKKLKFNKKS